MHIAPMEWVVVVLLVGAPLLGAGMAVLSSEAIPSLEWPAVIVLGMCPQLYAACASLWWALDFEVAPYIGTWCVACFFVFAARAQWFKRPVTTQSRRREFEIESGPGAILVGLLYAVGFIIRAA